MPSDCMSVIAIDPGGTIGVAVLSNFPIDGMAFKPVPGSGDVYYRAWMDTDPVKVKLGYILSPPLGFTHCVIEDFIGSGPRTKESNHTIKQIGYFYYSCIENKTPVRLATPFSRKRYIEWSKKLLKVKASDPKHAMDALAHCRVEWEKLKGGELV